MEDWRTKTSDTKLIEMIEKKYKYTTLTDAFVCKVLQNEFPFASIDSINPLRLNLDEGNGKETYTPVIRTNSAHLRLLNDFELGDISGKVNLELSLIWRKGMIKYGLPLKGKDNIDVGHYLNDLYVFENDKLRKAVGELSRLATERESDEKELD